MQIIAASYSHYRQKNKNIVGKKLEEENIDKITYYWLKTLPMTGKTIFLDYYNISISIKIKPIFKKLQTDYDLVVVSSPHPFQIYLPTNFAKNVKQN